MDAELLSLAQERERLLVKLGPLTRYAGPGNPNRTALNHARSVAWKKVKKQLKQNGEQIAARVMVLYYDEE